MAKVTHNSDKAEDVKTFKDMRQGEIGEVIEGAYSGRFVMGVYKDEVVDLSDGSTWDHLAILKVRILRPDESITLRNG